MFVKSKRSVWFGLVMVMKDYRICMSVEKPEGRNLRGRSWKGWIVEVEEDIKIIHLGEEEEKDYLQGMKIMRI